MKLRVWKKRAARREREERVALRRFKGHHAYYFVISSLQEAFWEGLTRISLLMDCVTVVEVS